MLPHAADAFSGGLRKGLLRQDEPGQQKEQEDGPAPGTQGMADVQK